MRHKEPEKFLKVNGLSNIPGQFMNVWCHSTRLKNTGFMYSKQKKRRVVLDDFQRSPEFKEDFEGMARAFFEERR